MNLWRKKEIHLRVLKTLTVSFQVFIVKFYEYLVNTEDFPFILK